MKLSQINAPRKTMKRVWQKEEAQGAKHPKRWYQSYARKATPYRQSRTTGPKPEGYEAHILKP